MRRFIPVGLLLSALAFAACSPAGGQKADVPVTIHLVSSGGFQVPVSVEIAADNESQERGLMGRETLKPDEGMLFVFPDNRRLGFWMKNTLIPLDILFFKDTGEFVSMTTMQLCTTPACSPYFSEGSAKFALEVPAGFIARHQVERDWKLALGQW